MSKDPLRSHEMYLNRELSWLEFNDRVLRQGLAEDVPLMERIKFLAIVSSNLDEFFLVRVAGLMSARAEGVRRRDPAGMTPAEQLKAVSQRVHRMVCDQRDAVAAALAQLAKEGLAIVAAAQWDDAQRHFLQTHFNKEVLPVLTPLAVQDHRPPPRLAGLQWHLAVLLKKAAGEEKIAVAPVPQQTSRWVRLSGDEVALARLDEVMVANAGAIFPARRFWLRRCSASPATRTSPSSGTRPTTCSRRSSARCSRGSAARRFACRSLRGPILEFASGWTRRLKTPAGRRL